MDLSILRVKTFQVFWALSDFTLISIHGLLFTFYIRWCTVLTRDLIYAGSNFGWDSTDEGHHIISCEGHRLPTHMGDYFFISSQNSMHCFAVQFELENISCCGYCVKYNWEDMALTISVYILHRMEECHVLKTSLRNLGSRMRSQRKLMKRTKVWR